MKYIFFKYLIFILTVTGFASSADFSVSYNLKNPLMKTSLAIEITGSKLMLTYENGTRSITRSAEYQITENESASIYSYLKSAGLDFAQTKHDRKPDSPIESISGMYDDKTFFVNLGNTPHETYNELKGMIFALADKYDALWRTDTDMQ